MKVLFVYFSKRAICSTAQEAIDFINSLHYRDRADFRPISVNDQTRRLLEEMYAQEWNTSEEYPFFMFTRKYQWDRHNTYQDRFYTNGIIRTTDCGNTDIYVRMPLADTLEEHDAIIAEQQRIKEEAAKKAAEEYEKQRNAELNEERHGLYSVRLSYTRLKIHSMRTVESVFSGKCYAKSGYDAYRKTIKELEKDGDASFGADFPHALSSRFEFYFIGSNDSE